MGAERTEHNLGALLWVSFSLGDKGELSCNADGGGGGGYRRHNEDNYQTGSQEFHLRHWLVLTSFMRHKWYAYA